MILCSVSRSIQDNHDISQRGTAKSIRITPESNTSKELDETKKNMVSTVDTIKNWQKMTQMEVHAILPNNLYRAISN